MQTFVKCCVAVGLVFLSDPSLAAQRDEFAGNSLEALRTDGARALVLFGTDGTIHFTGAYRGAQWEDDGTYTVEKTKFCFMLKAHGSECYTRKEKLSFGKPVQMKNVDKPELVATYKLVKGHDARLPADGTKSF